MVLWTIDLDANMKIAFDNWENFLFFSSLLLSIWHKNHNIGIIRKDIHPNADIIYDDKEDLVTVETLRDYIARNYFWSEYDCLHF